LHLLSACEWIGNVTYKYSLTKLHSLYCSYERETKLIEFSLSSLLQCWDGDLAFVTILLHFRFTKVHSCFIFKIFRWTNQHF